MTGLAVAPWWPFALLALLLGTGAVVWSVRRRRPGR
jgi:hypothetical protein